MLISRGTQSFVRRISGLIAVRLTVDVIECALAFSAHRWFGCSNEYAVL